MNSVEWRASLALAAIFGLRMLGMFIILPVFALYAQQLPGGDNHTLIGLALGAYGFTQALLQIPFGRLSDRWGRKPTIYLGLIVFALGSFIAAVASDIHMVIVGRIIQGAGAISAAVIALTADLTREEQRTKAMALIGVTIGGTFALSMVAGPVLNQAIGVPGIFALTGVLALGGIAVVRWVVPTPPLALNRAAREPRTDLHALFAHGELARLNLGIFALHAMLMVLFVAVPFQLRDAGLAAGEHWKVYLPVMLGSMLLMLPFMFVAERKQRQKPVFVAAVGLLVVAFGILCAPVREIWGMGWALLVFFTAFNLLEASLPSLISKAAPADAKGAAIGIYSSIQFLGTALGATAGGYLSQHFGTIAVYTLGAGLALVWLLAAIGMRPPERLRTRTYTVPNMDPNRAAGLSRKLAGLPGVREALVLASEGVAHLKVENAAFDERTVLKLIAGEG